jgi:Ca2+-binding RTX toxin-like protein
LALTADFAINSAPLGTSYSTFASTIAVLPDGTALVAWVRQVGQWSTEAEIYARWIGPDGTPVGADFLVNTTTTEFQWRPVAAVTAEGKVFLAWESGDGGDGDGMGLRGVVLDPLDQTPGSDFLINPVAVGSGIYAGQCNQSQVSLSALSDGRVFALWTSYDGSDGDGYAILGRYFGGDGTALGDDFVVNSSALGGQYEPQATELSDGRILVTYSSTDDADGTPGNIRARIIGTNGAFSGNDFVLNSTPGGYQSYVDVTALSNGTALVTWFSSGVFTPDPSGGNPTFAPGEVRARIIGADGLPLGPDFQVNSTDLSASYTKPVVTTLIDGRALVVWYSGDAGDGDWGCLRGRLIASDGQLIESDFVINTTDLNNQCSPAAEALPDGRILVTWTSDDGVGTGAQIRGIYINPIIGHDGSDVLQGTSGQDMLMGLAGDDSVDGGLGDDQLMGGAGNDLLTGAMGNDVMDGGTGSDRAYFTGTGAATVNLSLTIAQTTGYGTDTIVNVEHVTSGSGNDQLTGSDQNNNLVSGAGNDTLSGGLGIDTLDGGIGNDWLDGGVGSDSMSGGANDDTYVVDSSTDVVVELTSAGTDLVRSSADTFTLAGNVENLTLTGSSATNGSGNGLNNVLTGNSGNNTLMGDAGNDTLNGGIGADTLMGGSGNDTYVTDGGDMISEAASAGTDTVQSSVTTTLAANLENLTLTGSSAVNGSGNGLNNTITGNTAANTLIGGAGMDTLIGGAGRDSFVFNTVSDTGTTANASDVITDFVRGQDKINLSAIDAFAASASNEAFIWRGTAAFNSATQGEVRFQKFDVTGTTNDYTMVWIDNDNDTGIEMAIRLSGLHDLTAADFVL